MATPAVLYIDDRNPLILYMPNSSWVRGGNVSCYDGTSTSSSIAGTSASITFSGTGISALGTIEHLDPNLPEFVLSSYSVDGGPTTIYNATEQAQFQFQQLFFQSGPLVSGSHTLVVTQLTNRARLFLDFFMIIPPDSPITLAPTSTLPTSVTTSTVLIPPPTGGNAKSHSTPTAAIVGGSLGGLALICIFVLAFWFIRKTAKNNHQRPPPSQSFPHPPSNLSTSTTEPYRDSPGGINYNVASRPGTVTQFSYPTPSSPSQRMIPPSKAIQDARYMPVHPVPVDNPSNSHTQNEPPRYEQ